MPKRAQKTDAEGVLDESLPEVALGDGPCLVVDSSDRDRRVLVELLAEVGADLFVVEAPTQRIALSLVRQVRHIAVAWLSLALPDGNALPVIQALNRFHFGTPAFVFDGAPRPLVTAACAANPTGWLTKPLTAETLLESIRAAGARKAEAIERISSSTEFDFGGRGSIELVRSRAAEAGLTGQSLEAFLLHCVGMSRQEVKARMGITESTYQKHRSQMIRCAVSLGYGRDPNAMAAGLVHEAACHLGERLADAEQRAWHFERLALGLSTPPSGLKMAVRAASRNRRSG